LAGSDFVILFDIRDSSFGIDFPVLPKHSEVNDGNNANPE